MNSEKAQGKEELFISTRSPHLNEVLKAAQRIVEEEEWPATYVEALVEKTAALKEFGSSLSTLFASMKQVQEDTPVSRVENPRIEESFHSLHGALEEIAAFPERSDREQLLESLGAARKAIESLFASFDALRDDEQKLPVHCRSPFINELLRVGKGVVRGDFPVEALKAKLEWMMMFWAKTVQEFGVYRMGKMETVALEERVPEIEGQYEKMGFALKRMHGFLDSGSVEELEAAMEELRCAGESLVDLHAFIEHETRPRTTRPCLRCGLENPLDARFCQGCRFPIPDFSEKVDASSISYVEDHVPGTGKRVLTANLARLQEAVEGLESGACSLADFAKVLDWMESKVAEGRQQMAQVDMAQMPAGEEGEKAVKAHALLEAATARLEAGLAVLRRFVQEHERALLSEGLEKCLEGGDLFCELYMMAQECQSPAS